MSTYYRNRPVLELEPDGLDSKTDEPTRISGVVDSEAGKRVVIVQEDLTSYKMEFPLTITTRADLGALRSLLDEVSGMGGSFWLPTWDRDFNLIRDITANDAILYAQFQLFGGVGYGSAPCKDIALITRGLPNDYHRITTDSGIVDEELGISPVAVRARIAAATTLCFLRLVRLESDDVKLSHQTAGPLVTCALTLVGLPQET